MMPTLPLFFDARALVKAVLPTDDPRWLPSAVDSFVTACLTSELSRHRTDWEEFMLDHVQRAYIDISQSRGLTTELDGNTGRINNVCWYQRYIALMSVMEQHYRQEIQMAMQHAFTLGLTIKRMRYVQHTAHYLLIEATCQHLLTHDSYS